MKDVPPLKTIALAACLVLAGLAHATPNANADAEIRHLLDFVAASGCTFIRNGDAHNAIDAASHLAMKYSKAKSRLTSPEQFIEHVASKSFFTGTPYRVQCAPAASINSGDWLHAELAAWRAQQAGIQTSTSAGKHNSIASGR